MSTGVEQLTEEDLKGIEKIRKIIREGSCETCRTKGPGQCSVSREDSAGFIENTETNEKKYFCFLGCLMLYVLEQFGPAEFISVARRQFNTEGHYEKLRNG